jgi:hypothetical protein
VANATKKSSADERTPPEPRRPGKARARRRAKVRVGQDRRTLILLAAFHAETKDPEWLARMAREAEKYLKKAGYPLAPVRSRSEVANELAERFEGLRPDDQADIDLRAEMFVYDVYFERKGLGVVEMTTPPRPEAVRAVANVLHNRLSEGDERRRSAESLGSRMLAGSGRQPGRGQEPLRVPKGVVFQLERMKLLTFLTRKQK